MLNNAANLYTDPRGIASHLEAILKPALNILVFSMRRSGVPLRARYQQHLLHSASDESFSMVSLVWKPAQRTPIHDHLAWCVVGVYQDGELETRYQLIDNEEQQWLEPTGSYVHFSPGSNPLRRQLRRRRRVFTSKSQNTAFTGKQHFYDR